LVVTGIEELDTTIFDDDDAVGDARLTEELDFAAIVDSVVRGTVDNISVVCNELTVDGNITVERGMLDDILLVETESLVFTCDDEGVITVVECTVDRFSTLEVDFGRDIVGDIVGDRLADVGGMETLNVVCIWDDISDVVIVE
jgi:hypothetical protein